MNERAIYVGKDCVCEDFNHLNFGMTGSVIFTTDEKDSIFIPDGNSVNFWVGINHSDLFFPSM